QAVTTEEIGSQPDPKAIAATSDEVRDQPAVVAARQSDLEEAVALGLAALRDSRKSLPSLLMVAGELDVELDRQFGTEPTTAHFVMRCVWSVDHVIVGWAPTQHMDSFGSARASLGIGLPPHQTGTARIHPVPNRPRPARPRRSSTRRSSVRKPGRTTTRQ